MQEKLKDYVETFRKNSIDGGILEAIIGRSNITEVGGEMTLADYILQDDLGVKNRIHRLKIKSKFKRYSESPATIQHGGAQTM